MTLPMNIGMITILLLLLTACSAVSHNETRAPIPCAEEALLSIERQVTSSDSQGDGPDIGSQEWHSVVEFHLGVRGDKSVPARGTRLWCDFIEAKIKTSGK